MYKVDDMLGREVFNQDTGEKLASVEEVIFDDGTRSVVALLVKGGLLQSPGVMRWSSVANVADVVVVRGDGALGVLHSDPEVSALRRRSRKAEGKEAITREGEKVGEVSDVLVDDRGAVLGFEVKRGLVRDLAGREQVPIREIVSHGRDAILVTGSSLAYPGDPQRQRGREAEERRRERRMDEISGYAGRGSGEAR